MKTQDMSQCSSMFIVFIKEQSSKITFYIHSSENSLCISYTTLRSTNPCFFLFFAVFFSFAFAHCTSLPVGRESNFLAPKNMSRTPIIKSKRKTKQCDYRYISKCGKTSKGEKNRIYYLTLFGTEKIYIVRNIG